MKPVGMNTLETSEDRKKRFKAMSSDERKVLIREKMKNEGLLEGSGVSGKDLSSYDRDEIWDLVQVTRCFPELQTKKSVMQSKKHKNKALVAWILLALAVVGGLVLYYKQYPSAETRRELSVDGIFLD